MWTLPKYLPDFIIIVTSSSSFFAVPAPSLWPLPNGARSSPTALSTSPLCVLSGVVMIPGICQLTEKDLKYRLQASRAKCIITSDSLAARVDAISADCPSLQTKLLVSDSNRPGWTNFRAHLRWVVASRKLILKWSQGASALSHESWKALPTAQEGSELETHAPFGSQTDHLHNQVHSLNQCLAYY